MRLLFKQRFFTWFDSYDVYDENGDVYFTVQGKLSWGHEFHIFDRNHSFVGKLKEELFTFFEPKFLIFDKDNNAIGEIKKEFTFFKPSFKINMYGWSVTGDWLEWDYEIRNGSKLIAKINKELFNWTDTYTIDVSSENALNALMVVLAIDAVKCSKK